MPNWCNNQIVIQGPTDKVEAIWSIANDESDNGLLTALHPIGKWDYDLACEQWGTKWDVSMVDANLELIVQDSERSMIEGYFDSAWSPPLAAIENYLANNDDVEIHCKYYEPANDYIGSNYYGEFSISDQPRSFWETDEAGRELDETFYVLEMLDEFREDIEDEELDNDELVDPEKVPYE
jgi:hypothetical protein